MQGQFNPLLPPKIRVSVMTDTDIFKKPVLKECSKNEILHHFCSDLVSILQKLGSNAP